VSRNGLRDQRRRRDRVLHPNTSNPARCSGCRGRARAAEVKAGLGEQIVISVMHLAKGLEFRAVVVMACDQDILPLESRIAGAADEGELDDIYETERQLLYVACTRARDRLLVTGVAPASEFLKDL